MGALDTYHVYMPLDQEKETAICDLYALKKWTFCFKVLPAEWVDVLDAMSEVKKDDRPAITIHTTDHTHEMKDEDSNVHEPSCISSPPLLLVDDTIIDYSQHKELDGDGANDMCQDDDPVTKDYHQHKSKRGRKNKPSRRKINNRNSAPATKQQGMPKVALHTPAKSTNQIAPQTTGVDTKDVPPHAVDDGVDRQTCTYCSKHFSQHSYLRKHINRIHKPGFYCSICFAHFKSGKSRDSHKRKEHGNMSSQIQCELCGNIYNAKGAMQEHLLAAHSEGRPFACDLCNKAFKTRRILKIHKIRHGASNEICSVCGKTFKLKMEVVSHMRRHLKDKNIKCESCGKMFYRRTELKLHLRTHTGERPYKCALCSYSCSIKGNLDKHMRVHDKGLDKHMQIHDKGGVKRQVKCVNIQDPMDLCEDLSMVGGHMDSHIKPNKRTAIDQWTTQYQSATQSIYEQCLPIDLAPVGVYTETNYSPTYRHVS